MLLAYVNKNLISQIARIPDVAIHQIDGMARVFKFPVERLEQVAAILKPRKRRAIGKSPEQMRAMRERRKSLAQMHLINLHRTIGPRNEE